MHNITQEFFKWQFKLTSLDQSIVIFEKST